MMSTMKQHEKELNRGKNHTHVYSGDSGNKKPSKERTKTKQREKTSRKQQRNKHTRGAHNLEAEARLPPSPSDAQTPPSLNSLAAFPSISSCERRPRFVGSPTRLIFPPRASSPPDSHAFAR